MRGCPRATALGNEARDQLVDYEIYREIVDTGLAPGFATNIRDRLFVKHNVSYSRESIYIKARNIKENVAILNPSADVNGAPTARNGKGHCYDGFWTQVDMFLPNLKDRYYIGLTANQIDVVRSRIQSEKMIVCECNPQRANDLVKYAEFLQSFKTGPAVQLEQRDIFEVLKENSNSFNIIDLDLMCHLSRDKGKIDRWAKILLDSAKPGKVVILIATSIGRGCFEAEWKERSEYLYRSLLDRGFGEIGRSDYSYRDRRVPMRVMRMVFEK